MAEKMTDQEIVVKLTKLLSSGTKRGEIQKAFGCSTMNGFYNLAVPAYTRQKATFPLLPESTLGGGKKPYRVVAKNGAIALSPQQVKEAGFTSGEKVNVTFAKGSRQITLSLLK